LIANISSWGRYPTTQAEVERPQTLSACRASLLAADAGNFQIIARGLGRSYGDSALSNHVLDTHYLTHFHDFDAETGVLSCAAGVSLGEILKVFVPRGWFLPVVPGTKFVTVGGAIASDVHGKNHHIDGTFGQHVLGLELLLGNGELATCSPERQPELFHATCGGMGLTGIIVSAKLQLRRIHSADIVETTRKTDCLEAVLEEFDNNPSATYSVAWIDCLATGKRLGRSLLLLGEHADEGDLRAAPDRALPLPLDWLSPALNQYSIKAFNALYYHLKAVHKRRTSYDAFFFPLDKLDRWNLLYGRAGFLQYQFVLPLGAGLTGLRQILKHIAASGRGSFLAVLKVFGPGNRNPLSFPIEGYNLALDFKNEKGVFRLLDELDELVLANGGRLYLAKDARMTEATFKQGYPAWRYFESVRRRYHACNRFASLQSQRLGLR
jgi:decaprenylphospho-beta-D-ribofuranose 2-oxidase